MGRERFPKKEKNLNSFGQTPTYPPVKTIKCMFKRQSDMAIWLIEVIGIKNGDGDYC